MTKFTCFTSEELKDMGIAFENEGLGYLYEEVRAEKNCREKIRRIKMTRFTCFTDKELNAMEYGFNIALDNTGLDTAQQIIKNIIGEIQSEMKLREKEEVHYTKYPHTERLREKEEEERRKALREELKRFAMDSNYGMATSSCDDEKLVVLLRISNQLKGIYETLEVMQETIERVDDKV